MTTELRAARLLVWDDSPASGLTDLHKFTAPSTEQSCLRAAEKYRSRIKDGVYIPTPELKPCEHLDQERRARMHCFIKEAEMKQRSSTSHRATVSINNMGTMPHGVIRRRFHLMEVVQTAAEELSTLLAMPSGGDALLGGHVFTTQSLASASFDSIVESLVIDDDECGSVPEAMVEPVLNQFERLLAVARNAPRRMITRSLDDETPVHPWPIHPLSVLTAAPMGSKKVLNLLPASAALEELRLEFDEAGDRGEEPPWRAVVLPRGDGDDGPERTAHWVRLFKDDGEAKPSIQMKARLPSRPFAADDGSSAANRPRTLAALIAECLGRLQPPHIEDDDARERAREEELAMESYDEGETGRRVKRPKKVHQAVSVADAQEKLRKFDGDAKKWATGYVIDQLVGLIKQIKPSADLKKKRKKEEVVAMALEALGEM